MRSIRISDFAYNFLKRESEEEQRSLTKTLDLFILLVEGARDEIKLESKGVSSSKKKR